MDKISSWIRERGIIWAFLYTLREVIMRSYKAIMLGLESKITDIERKRMIIGQSTISFERNTRADNLRMWTAHDWSRFGEEWTEDAREFRGIAPTHWKQALIAKVLMPQLRNGMTILEIGPGGGRWTEVLLPFASKLLLADITERCLEICRKRFLNRNNIEYYLVDDSPWLMEIGDDVVDLVWSYDTFVHINPLDTQAYVEEIGRVLNSTGCAIIHHPGEYESYEARLNGFRSNVDPKMFETFVQNNGMMVISQDFDAPHMEGDCITRFRKREQ